ncbi:MAG: transposase [Planctomycetaceae bacterium]|nr:transposase [Planctomycetaceae bacterium]
MCGLCELNQVAHNESSCSSFEDFIFYLTAIHHYYGGKVIIVWDNLPAHHAAATYFEFEHPDWFEVEYFPTYSPELNPVESCWHQIKNVYLPNFVPTSDDELVSAAHAAKRLGKYMKNCCRYEMKWSHFKYFVRVHGDAER